MKGLIFALLIGLTTPLFADFNNSQTGQKAAAKKSQWLLTSYNVRMFGASSQEKETKEEKVLKNILKEIKPDLLAVQEVVGVDQFKTFIRRNFRTYKTILSNCGGTGRQMLGFVYDNTKFEALEIKEDMRIKDPKRGCHEGLRPTMVVKFKERSTGFEFTAFSIHLKAGGYPDSIETRRKQYGRLTSIIRSYRKMGRKNLILMGDFNTTEYIKRNQYYQRFVNFVDDNNLEDLAQDLNCSSYWSGENRDDNFFEASLLDHVLISYNIKRKFKRAYTRAKAHCQKSYCRQETPDSLGLSFTEVSDHCPVVSRLN